MSRSIVMTLITGASWFGATLAVTKNPVTGIIVATAVMTALMAIAVIVREETK